jgi:nucleoside-diphosphate-sugar epimerase
MLWQVVGPRPQLGSRLTKKGQARGTLAADLQVLKGGGSEGGYRGRIFVASDNTPVTFEAMIKACTDSGAFEGDVEFIGTAPPTGKRMYSRKTKETLGWQPQYKSFVEFMHETKGKDWYSSSL